MRYLVDDGRRVPQLIRDAETPQQAAFLAWLLLEQGHQAQPAQFKVLEFSDEETATVLVLADRKCKECGCSEAKVCAGGCCWMAWDLCSRCL